MRTRIFTLIIMLLVVMISPGCVKDPPPEESCNFQQNSKGRRVSWFRLPIQFYVDDSVSWKMVEVIEAAMKTWNRDLGREIFVLVGRTDALPGLTASGTPPQDGYNGIYFVKDGTGFRRTEQARTHLYHRGDFIHEADISINGEQNFFLDYKTDISKSGKSSTQIDFLSLMIHELGHALGLGHIKASEATVMKSTLDPGEAGDRRRSISDLDKQSLACEY